MNMSKSEYYTIDRILKENAQYNIIIGERSNGKTYSVENYALERYCKTGEQLGIIRRWDTDFTGKRGQQMFEALVNNGLVEKYTNGQYTTIRYMSSRWYLAKYDETLEKFICKDEPFCYAFALNTGEHDKSISFPKITTILFDEFLTRTAYITDEFIVFQNVLSTIIRDRDNVKIFMCGNTVNKYSPYFAEMGLSNIEKMKQDDIDVYTYPNTELRVAVEYSTKPTKKKKSDKYFAFNNPKLNMITNGSWEISIYPHLPEKYENKDIKFIYYVLFNKKLLQCNIIKKGNSIFTYIHRKTTAIKNEDKKLLYTTEYDKRPNVLRHIDKPINEYTKKVWWFYKNDKVFYQDNEIGEIMRNYINWCKNDRGIV